VFWTSPDPKDDFGSVRVAVQLDHSVAVSHAVVMGNGGESHELGAVEGNDLY